MATALSPPRADTPAFLTPEEVVDIARAGQQAGCKEALFTLGDAPEVRYPQAQAWLEARGYTSTVEYLRAVAIAVIEETGLLPHLNPGVVSLPRARRRVILPKLQARWPWDRSEEKSGQCPTGS